MSLARVASRSLAIGALALLGVAAACSPAATATPTTAPATATPTTAAATPTPTRLAPTPTSAGTTPTATTSTPTQVAPTATPTRAAVATATPTRAPTPVPTTGGQVKRGGVLKSWSSQDLPNFDIHNAISASHIIFTGKMYNGVIRNAKGTEIECDTCESFTLEDGGKTYVFKLIRGVKFHNGKEMTAADVEYSYKKMLGFIDGVASSRVATLKDYLDVTKGGNDGVEVVDPYTLKVYLKQPSGFAPKVMALAFAGIVPEGTTRDQLRTQELGTGPFKFKERVQGSTLTMERNPTYFRSGLPYMDGVVHSVINDEAAFNSAFLTNRIDYLRLTDGVNPTFQSQYDAKVKTGDIVVQSYPRAQTLVGPIFNMTKAPFDNVKVRQALNLVIDRSAYRKSVAEGMGDAQGLIAPEDGGKRATDFWDKVAGFATGANKQKEVDEAKRLIAEAGYTNGFEANLLSRNGSEQGAEFLQAEFAKIGVRSKLIIKTTNENIADMNAKNYDISWQALVTATGDPDEILGLHFVTGGSRNYAGYSSAEVDRLFTQQSQETDPVKRRDLNRQIEEIILRDVPFATLTDTGGAIGLWKWVKGFDSGLGQYYSALVQNETVWLDK